ncbi:MAG TPA: MFS transporter [Alphaproteobacteria bacterium]|nr:MFS transporter [Alphaproteobacteria bacterium]
MAGGSWRPLLAWALASLFFCYGFVQRVSPSVMVEELMRDFAVSATILGNLSAFYFYAYAALQVPVGLLMDRIGPRRLMTAAAAVAAAGSLIFAASEAIAGAYVGRLLIGAGAAFSWVGVLTILTQWFPARRFALFTGMAQAMGMAGAIFGQTPLAVSVEQAGWRMTVVVIAGIGLAIAIGMWLVVRDKPHASASSAGILASLKVLLSNRETWLNAVFGLAMTAPMLAFAALWAVPYLTTVYGIERSAATGVLSFMFAGWAIGAPFMGWLSDRIGARRPVMIVGALINVITYLVVIQLPSLPLAAVSAIILVHGVGASAMVLGFAAVREHNPPEMSSTAMGIVNVAVIGSGAIFQPLVGWLLDLQWSGELGAGVRVYSAEAFRIALSVLSVAGIGGLCATLLMKESLARRPA